MANRVSHGKEIDALLHDYLHSDEMRQRVAEGADAAAAAAHAELAPFTRTGDLERATSTELHEFDAGWGLEISTLWRSYFVANKAGRTRNREPGYRRGQGIRRARGFRATAPYRLAANPSVIGEAVFAATDLWETT